MDDVVIGAIRGHTWSEIEHYAISLCRTGFTGTKLMFVDGVDNATKTILAGLGFRLVDCPRPPYNLCFAVDRFYFASEWLKANPCRYAVWTDVRDTVFQTNPITWLENNKGAARLLIGSENILIKNEELHNRWARLTYGAEGAAALADEVAINCGTLAGDGDAVQQLFAANYEGCYQVRGTGMANSGNNARDQIVMNYLIRQSPFKELVRIPRQFEGFAVMCGISGQAARFAGRLIDTPPHLRGDMLENTLGMPISIIHQYDKNPEWKAVLLAKYRATPVELRGRR